MAETGTEQTLTCRCCIVGGGPAGVMLGYLLARAGVDAIVLEKHADFFRDFRGDTVHPSTLELMHELGIIADFLRRPHQEARTLTGQVGDYEATIADFTHLPVRSRFIALMPQWDFLDFLAGKAKRYEGFRLLMNVAGEGLIEEGGRVAGVRAKGPDGPVAIRADLVVGADGRRSTIRTRAGLPFRDLGAPMDVLWFGLPRHESDPDQPLGRFTPGQIVVLINRGDYFQCGFVIAKGAFDEMQAEGLDAFRERVARAAPLVRDRVSAIKDWDEVKLLTVTVDRLDTWHRPGLLCIGDAAHAMSPVGGVGINLAIQDAVAAANILAEPLRAGGPVDEALLAAVQARRTFPVRVTQRLQVMIQDRVIRRTLGGTQPMRPPWVMRVLNALPLLRRLPARLVGLGIRPEHIRTPDVGAQASL